MISNVCDGNDDRWPNSVKEGWNPIVLCEKYLEPNK